MFGYSMIDVVGEEDLRPNGAVFKSNSKMNDSCLAVPVNKKTEDLIHINLTKEVWNLNAMCIVSWKIYPGSPRPNNQNFPIRTLPAKLSMFLNTALWFCLRTIPILLTLMQIAITYAITDEGTARKVFTEGDGTFQPKSFKLSRWAWEEPRSWNDLLSDLRPPKETVGCRTAAASCVKPPASPAAAPSAGDFCHLWIWAHCLPWEARVCLVLVRGEPPTINTERFASKVQREGRTRGESAGRHGRTAR